MLLISTTSLVANDWNHVIVWFDVLEFFVVNVTIKNCGVHVTKDVDEIENDAGWLGIIDPWNCQVR